MLTHVGRQLARDVPKTQIQIPILSNIYSIPSSTMQQLVSMVRRRKRQQCAFYNKYVCYVRLQPHTADRRSSEQCNRQADVVSGRRSNSTSTLSRRSLVRAATQPPAIVDG